MVISRLGAAVVPLEYIPFDAVNPLIPLILFDRKELKELPVLSVDVVNNITPVVVEVAWLSRFKFLITLFEAPSTNLSTDPIVAADLVFRMVHSFKLPVPPGLPSN